MFSEVDLPFILPHAVSQHVFRDLLRSCVTLSRSRVESKCLGKSLVLGSPELFGAYVVERAHLKGKASYSALYKLGQSDGGLAVNGETGDLVAKVSFAVAKQHYPDWTSNPWLEEVGERHRSCGALAHVLGLNKGGICFLVSESFEINTVKVFVNDEVWVFSVNPGEQAWLRLHPP